MIVYLVPCVLLLGTGGGWTHILSPIPEGHVRFSTHWVRLHECTTWSLWLYVQSRIYRRTLRSTFDALCVWMFFVTVRDLSSWLGGVADGRRRKFIEARRRWLSKPVSRAVSIFVSPADQSSARTPLFNFAMTMRGARTGDVGHCPLGKTTRTSAQ